jgi:Protein of unknown function (DUF3500)
MTARQFRGFPVRDRFYAANAPRMTKSDREERLRNALSSDHVPYVGITTDGVPRRNLFELSATGISTRPISYAARGFIELLSEAQSQEVMQPLDGIEWSLWHNAFELPCGASMTEMSEDQRSAFLAVMKASMSSSGFETVRNAMKLNAALGEIVDVPELKANWLGEWNYGVRLFGTPSEDRPWGWQLHGHHLILSCFVAPEQVVMTPTFVGGEPVVADEGMFAGLSILDDEQAHALDLMSSLTGVQREKATLFPSILAKDLPPELAGPANGRHLSGALRDNLVVPYQGVCAESLSAQQSALLLCLIETYVGRIQSQHARLKMAEVKAHLDSTWFAWIGSAEMDAPFYYRIHSPVILIEFDCHPGIFLANDNPERFHIHTIVRTPNGNDYGRDLLRQHYEKEHRSTPQFTTLQEK